MVLIRWLNEIINSSLAPPHCIAPEVLSAEGPFTEKVDWWSIGVIAYTLYVAPQYA